jgi:uncharacterized protein (DUF952 family)
MPWNHTRTAGLVDLTTGSGSRVSCWKVRLFHITAHTAWEAASQIGEYHAPSLETEGFIHLSTDHQWEATAKRFFRGQSDLVLLMIRRFDLKPPLRFESADGDKFPHLYGPLNVDAVAAACPLDSAFSVPSEVAAWRRFFYGPPRIIPIAPSFETLVRETALEVQDVALCAVDVHGRTAFYLCFGAKPGHKDRIPLDKLRFATARITNAPIDRIGTLQLGTFLRRRDGSIDEPWLLAHVQSLVGAD